MEIPTLHESRRGCGYRKPGGLYLVSGRTMEVCGLLPIVLDVCPTCNAGIKPTRGFTWVDADKLLDAAGVPADGPAIPYIRPHGTDEHTVGCPLARPVGRAGLIWIGEAFYATPAAFMDEAEQMGVSRRIPAVPKDFQVGQTLVLLAHRKGTSVECDCTSRENTADGVVRSKGQKVGDLVSVTTGGWPPEPDCEECLGTGRAPQPAIFTAFIPKAVEYVVKGDEPEEELERMVKRGIRPVKVEPAEETLAVGEGS